MSDNLLAFIISQIVCTPIYIAAYVDGREKRRRREQLYLDDYKKAEISLEIEADREKCHEVLYGLLRALKEARMGAPFVTDALRLDYIDRKLALSAISLSRNESMKWADYSTEDSARHWKKVGEIFDEAENKLKEGEGV